MSKDHEGAIKGYTLTSETYYPWVRAKGEVDEVLFGFYHPTGGTSGKMSMTWHWLDRKPVPRLEVFCDSWHALSQFGDVLEALAELDGQDITPQQFCTLLGQCGFVDRTERKEKR